MIGDSLHILRMSNNNSCGVLAQEVFTALLMQPVANLAAVASMDNQLHTCDITVADILGPLLEKEAGTSSEMIDGSDRARDAKLSLLSYSFSLVGRSSRTSNNMQLCQGWLGRLSRCGQCICI